MSPKTLFLAAAAFAASSAATLPASAAPAAGDPGQGPAAQARPVPLRAEILFNLIDRNGDGTIDPDELAALQKAIFSALDTNQDGKLSQDEFRKIAMGMDGGPRPGMHRPDGRGPGMGGPGFHRWGFPGGQRDGRQGQLDDQQGPGGPQLGDNQDGQPPAGAPQPQNFASLDKNGDGVITPDEFAAGGPDLPGVPPMPPAVQQ